MKLIITIDTEEDNWGHYSPSARALENIERIPRLQQVFDEFNAKPTYLITYPVAADERAVSILKKISDAGRCEVGTHCHPWNTPPFEEETSEMNSMLSNLPQDLQYRKIQSLHETIHKHFGVEPVCFRSGRWSYDAEIARNLCRLGYKVDTSVTAYTDWTKYYGSDFTNISPQPARLAVKNSSDPSSHGPLVEIPATVGFLQKNFGMSNFIHESITRKRPLSYLKLAGVLRRLNLINKVSLSPEVASGKEMIGLARRMMQNRYPVMNMFFHSPSLKAGLTPFVKSRDGEGRFIERIEEFLLFARDAGIESIKLSEAAGLVP